MADMMCSKCGGKFIECDCSLPSRISHRKAATMSDNRVVKLRERKQAKEILQRHAQSSLDRVTHMCWEDALDAVTEALSDTRTLDPSIESLQAEVGRLREALEKIRDFEPQETVDGTGPYTQIALAARTTARQALAAKEQTR